MLILFDWRLFGVEEFVKRAFHFTLIFHLIFDEFEAKEKFNIKNKTIFRF